MKKNAEDYENAKERHEHRLCEEIKASLINGIDYEPGFGLPDYALPFSLNKVVMASTWFGCEESLQDIINKMARDEITKEQFKIDLAELMADRLSKEMISMMEDEQV